MMSQNSLPDSLVPLSLDILRKLSSDEHDLIRIVVEVIHDLRDTEMDEDDFVRIILRGVSLRIYLNIFTESKKCGQEYRSKHER